MYTGFRLVIIILIYARADDSGGRVCLHLFYGVSVAAVGGTEGALQTVSAAGREEQYGRGGGKRANEVGTEGACQG